MNDIYKQADDFVKKAFGPESTAYNHLARTVYWVKELNPDADEALLIAAISHDIERATRQNDIKKILHESEKGFADKDFLRIHQNRGADIMTDFLKSISVESGIIERVAHLIRGHEVGGDDDQNLLKDADSVSFMENNLDHFLSPEKLNETSPQKVDKKISWMFERISSDLAREIAKPMYEDAMKRLENV